MWLSQRVKKRLGRGLRIVRQVRHLSVCLSQKEDDEEDKLFDSAVIISRLSLFQKKYDPEDFSMILIIVFIPWVLSSSMESLCILSRFFGSLAKSEVRAESSLVKEHNRDLRNCQ